MISISKTSRTIGLSIASVLLAAMALGGCKKQEPPASTPAEAAMPSTPGARKAAKMPFTSPPAIKRNLYPSIGEGPADVKKGIAEASREHKRVILDFGGDWCGDCQVLDIYFNQPPNAQLLADNFVKVNVNIGRQDANVDLAKKYGVPLDGVPALAVLDDHGKVLYSQNQEFSDMRYMEPQSVTDFLNKWKAGT